MGLSPGSILHLPGNRQPAPKAAPNIPGAIQLLELACAFSGEELPGV